MKFAHLADAHLGYEQYHLPFRAEDFAKSFKSAVESVVEQDVDIVIISGDLFHRSNPNPKTIKQAIEILNLLRRENIPVFAIEGNHDKTIKDVSIYDLLESLGLLFKLGLRKKFVKSDFLKSKTFGNYSLVYANYDGLTIFGDTHRSSHQFKLLMEDRYLPDCDIVVLHMSVKEVVDFEIRDDYVTLKDLPKAKYYALGHIHIPILKNISDSLFVYPGCPERFDAREYSLKIDYFDELVVSEGYEKGFFIVKNFKPKFVKIDCRDLILANLSVKDQKDALSKIKEILDFLNTESLLILRIYGERTINVEEIRAILERNVKNLRISFEKISKERKVEVKKINEVFSEFELSLIEYLKRSDFESIIDIVQDFVEREFGLRKREKKVGTLLDFLEG